jgi:hypothetical protein
MGQTVFTASNASWPTPSDWTTSNYIEGIAGGGGGDDGHTGFSGGGGGGAYGKAINQALTASTNNNITVGAAGTGGTGTGNPTSGTATSFVNSSSTTLMSANGGSKGNTSGTSPSLFGPGGTTGIGSTVYAGGAGSAQTVNLAVNVGAGGGGGGAGGPNGIGGAGGAPGTPITASAISGSGGGGAGGGAQGGQGLLSTTATAGPFGGTNFAGTGAGAGGSAAGGNGGTGIRGGGGGGGGADFSTFVSGTGGLGSTENGTTYTPSWGSAIVGSGSGAGGNGATATGTNTNTNTNNAGLYGGGGGGGCGGGGGDLNGGNGAQGIVVITWASSILSTARVRAPFIPDRVYFTAVSGGAGDFAVSAAITGYQTPAQANAKNGAKYSYFAQSSDLTQWEYGIGPWNSSTNILQRLYPEGSSTGARMSFTNPPNVALDARAEDVSNIADSLHAFNGGI